MRKILNGENVWPPKGWTSLGRIKHPAGQSLEKDEQSARVRGLIYRIVSDPIHARAPGDYIYIHHVRIDGWEYTIRNDSSEYPVLSFNMMDRFDPKIPEEYYVSSIRALAYPVGLSENTVCRTINLFRFLVHQIDKGKVPDIDRAMRMYRLHPLQLHTQDKTKKAALGWPLSDYSNPTGSDY